MRTRKNEHEVPASRVRRGRAVVVGVGLDDCGGHIRYTNGQSFELYGGSENAHAEMQRRMRHINEEIARLGISLDTMTYEQFVMLKDVVERVNAE